MEKDATEARVAASPSSLPQRSLHKREIPANRCSFPSFGTCLPLSYVKAKQRELLPEKTRAVKRMKEVIYVWNIVSHDMKWTRGHNTFLPFLHLIIPSWQNECIPPTHTCPAWPTDLGPSLFSSPVILSSCERAQIHL